MLDIVVEKHHMHKVLKDAGITHLQAARFCGCGQSGLTQILNSYRPCPPWLEAKLSLLKERIDREAMNAN